MTTFLAPLATVTIPGALTAVDVSDATAALDSGAVPYASSEITLPLTDLAAIEAIDPRRVTRADLTLSDDVAGTARTFDLVVNSRSVDHKARTVRVGLASDEALAQQYTPLTTDTGAFAYQSSLRGVCDYVLSKVPGVRRNFVDYPMAGAGSGWGVASWGTGGVGTVNLNASTGVGNFDPPIENMPAMSLSWTVAPTGGTVSVDTGLFPFPAADERVTFSGYLASTISSAQWRAVVQFWSDSGFISSTTGPASSGGIDGTGRYAVTAPAPAGTTRARLTWQLAAGVVVAGSYAWFTAAQAEISGRVTPWAERVISPWGGYDADLTAYWPVTNLMPNPSARGIVGNWIAGGVNGTLTRMTTGIGVFPGAPDVTTYFRTVWAGNSGAGQGGAYGQTATLAPFTPVTQGRAYRVSVWARSNVVKTVELRAQVFGRDGTVLNPGVTVGTVTLPANTWVRVSGAIDAPAEAERLGPFLYVGTGLEWAAGQVLDTTCWMLYEDTIAADVPYFDGATPADANYTYPAVGAAHASASVRTPVNERLPDIFTWRPDTSAWSFLMSLAASSGLKLFCDERRVWRLINPDSYTVPGDVLVGTENGNVKENAVDGTDSITRDDENWCTGVNIRWRWRDTWGIERERFETAGAAGRVRQIDMDRAYPGPGLAAAILTRASDQGRVQDVTALADLSATPGMGLAVTLPGTRPQRTRLTSVEWVIGDALMRVTGRNAKTTPERPDPVVVIDLNAVTGTGTVTWTAPDDGGSPILEYQGDLFNATRQSGETVPGGYWVNPFTWNFSGQPGDVFRVSFRARNAVGWGPWSVSPTIIVP